MVPRGSKRRMQILENRAAIMFHGTSFSMHEIRGSDYLASEGGAQSLMSKAYAENWELPTELAEQLDADPRILRRAWAGRDANALRTHRCNFFYRNLIVAPHHNFSAQLTQVLHQVVGEGIVIIEDKNHSYQITSAAGYGCVGQLCHGLRRKKDVF